MKQQLPQIIVVSLALAGCFGCAEVMDAHAQGSNVSAEHPSCYNQHGWIKSGPRVAPLVSKTVVLPAGKINRKNLEN